MKLFIRTFLGLRIVDDYENHRRSLKENHVSRKGFSIDSDLLKKIDFWFSEKKEDSFACTMSDLEVCCDMQLPSIDGEAVKLIIKVLPRWKHFIGTTHSVSKESYGG